MYSNPWSVFIGEARTSFREELNREKPTKNKVDEFITEMADSDVPDYTYELLELAQDNLGLATKSREDPVNSAVEAISLNIYDELVEAYYEEYEEAKEEWKRIDDLFDEAETDFQDWLDNDLDAGDEDAQEAQLSKMLDRFEDEDIDVYKEAEERLEDVLKYWRSEREREA